MLGAFAHMGDSSLPGFDARARRRSWRPRCWHARPPPRFAGEYALLRFSSAAQVHPLIATCWAQRLRNSIVIAANDGYLPGRVNFAVRSARDVDLVDRLRALSLDLDPEFAHGHARATGGSVTPGDFERLLAALGFAIAGSTEQSAQRTSRP